MDKSELVTLKLFKGMFEGLVDEVQRTNKEIITELRMHVAAMDKLDDRLVAIEKRLDNHADKIELLVRKVYDD